MPFDDFLSHYQTRTQTNLADLFTTLRERNHLVTERTPLIQAMEYACLNGGKRLRPLLVYATGKDLHLPDEYVDSAALAIELIHCYSLIHDDLPAMDDDDLRRGKPTCHKAFDEATAILAGDALQALAFQLLAESPYLTDTQKINMLRAFSDACGVAGMAGGQALDLCQTKIPPSLEELSHTHLLKTGALIHTSVELAAFIAPALPEETKNALDEFSYFLGLGFQIQDDVLDAVGSTEKTGKNPGSDERQQRVTYVTLLNVEEAQDYASQCYASARAALEKASMSFPMLQQLIEWMSARCAE